MDHKPIGGVSVHRSRSQMVTVKVMTITIDSLLPRPKLDCNVGYDAAAKGASVVVLCHCRCLNFMLNLDNMFSLLCTLLLKHSVVILQRIDVVSSRVLQQIS
jgi:hypothetical protein